MKYRTLKLSAAALIIAGAAALAAPSFAQDYYDSDGVTVIAPIHRHYEGRSAIGAPIETVTMQRVVYTRDLDLRSDRDVNRLYRRIDYTARQTCAALNQRVDLSLTTDSECYRDAVRDAYPQAEGLVARARY